MHIKSNEEGNCVEANINEKCGLKKKRETHPLCESCNYKFTIDASDVSATWCVPPLIYYLNNASVEMQPAW